MAFMDVFVPLCVLGLAYVLLFAAGCSQEDAARPRRARDQGN
jgi:hypothetical protein